MKHFLNNDLIAPNVMTVAVDKLIVDEFLPLAEGSRLGPGYIGVRPPWESDIRWISANNPSTFARFESAFKRLQVAKHVRPYLDIQSEVRLYAGFVVTRSKCEKPNFHHDWDRTNNEAFTLITPITDNGADFGLLYRTLKGDVKEYNYRAGEALIFGDHFIHSTKPGRSSQPVVLLSFTFGTDKMKHWNKIARTAADQSSLLRRPDGKLIRINIKGLSIS